MAIWLYNILHPTSGIERAMTVFILYDLSIFITSRRTNNKDNRAYKFDKFQCKSDTVKTVETNE